MSILYDFAGGFAMYVKYIRINYRAMLEYKGWPVMLLTVLFTTVTDPIATIFLFMRFGNIGDWSLERIMLVYALAVASFGLAELFFRGFDSFPWRLLRTGDFDRLLLRPRSLFVQVAAAFFHVHRLARVGGALFAVCWALSRMGVNLGAADYFLLLLALVGGTLTYGGVFVITSGVAFFTIQGLEWIYIFSNGSYQVTRCPFDYLPKALKGFFTFVMPMFIISYYPAAAVCGWGDYWKGFMALPAGLAFLTVSLGVWRFGVRYYKSTGS
jgi:ABC-2 type transport system permease protein